ncbi:MAG TPA: alpha/beta hydrolase [Gemmatimonadaceae bacterium]|nr:alpha/beta hydrolase [Gemmatimonadaceae bacterium]
MMKMLLCSVALTLACAASMPAQDLTCRGVAYDVPGLNDGVISLDMRRRDGEWKPIHGRIGDAGSLHPTSTVTRHDSLIVVFDELHATFAGPLTGNQNVIRGAWTKGGTRMPLNVRCRADAPVLDTTHHTVRYVAVEKGVQLEVLDWGGTGRPVVLLHGLNATAHVFDEFAPVLAKEYHVYGITRRGSGRSSMPDSGYSFNRKGDDVVAVLDSLHLAQPVLVGHSAGGGPLSSVGSRYPKRVAGLVYLDAAYPNAWIDTSRLKLDSGLTADDLPKCPCSPIEQAESEPTVKHFDLPLPVLAIYAMQPDWETRTFDSRAPDWTPAAQSREFERGVPTARVVRIPNATHEVYRSNQAHVLEEMRKFIRSLPPVKP